MNVGRARKGPITNAGRFVASESVAADVLAFLATQSLDPTPPNYELGYLYQTDPACLAARAIDAILITGASLSQDQADEIYSAYRALSSTGGAGVEIAAESRNGVRLRHQTLQLHDLASDAASATGRFGRDLSAELDQIDEDDLPIAKSITTMIARSSETERHLVSALKEIDALHAEVAAAQNDALRDSLTGLVNRRGFEAELAKAEAGTPVALAICDIDRFKAINDRYGHPVGDRVIKAVSEAIARSCAPHIVARWGGEEFVILMRGVTRSQARAVITAANEALQRRTFRLRETDQALDPITFSAGIVMTSHGAALDAIAAADALLYRAKREGRNRVCVEGLSPDIA
ncbi:GGDEF domain-containing protein [Sphingomonas sp. PAMC 26605]|uniref:GGDEF domain-containing protein n=1 Tax=Sphingomonas sp. PAMC 26605 TaxID=1112214 RepID=UPI00026CD1A8|nr:GGDEF domain-containing protein [Sphingomonas sp. PAMC 26605]